MSVSGIALGTLIASKVIPLTAPIDQRLIMTDTWIKVGDAICEFLSTAPVLTDTSTLIAPGPIVLANGGGPCAGTIVLPPNTAKILLP
jgi:hypothetical protein